MPCHWAENSVKGRPPPTTNGQTPPTGGRHRSIDYCERATSPQAPGLGTTHYCQAWGYWLPCVHCVYVLAAMSDTRFLASVQYQSAPLDLKTATSAATDSNRSQCPRTHRTRRAYGCARCNCMLLLLVVVVVVVMEVAFALLLVAVAWCVCKVGVTAMPYASGTMPRRFTSQQDGGGTGRCTHPDEPPSPPRVPPPSRRAD